MSDVDLSIEVGGSRVQLAGELDLLSAHMLDAALDLASRSIVVLDLSGLRFMDATGIQAIVRARNRVRSEGNDLEIRGAHGLVRRAFELSDLAELLAD